MFFDAVKRTWRFITNASCVQRELCTMSKFDDCEFPSCLGTLVYLINSEIVFVCLSVTDHIW